MCCGPCSAFPLASLRTQGHTVTGWFYNPNIHPYKEFKRRLDTAVEFAAKSDLTIQLQADYTLEEFLRGALSEPVDRCNFCYSVRLEAAAKTAKEQGFDAFTTSLLVSPYQKHDLIRQAATAAARANGIVFLYQDWRDGWKEGVARSIELELYRQPYCGCVFSERDRYCKSRIKTC